ncbi:MAG: FHA domain-containing protein [Muribaculaceae bacterium]
MAKLIPCPHCGADIENDSCYCDQCGAQLLQCPKCGEFRKGKFCPTCGVPTSAPGGAPAGQPAPAGQSQQPVQPVQPAQPMQPQQFAQSMQPRQPQQYAQSVQPQQYAQPQQPVQPVQPPRPQQQSTGTALPPSDNAPACLRADALGITLPLKPGAVIGRVNGDYVAQVCTLQYISGTHARIDRGAGSQWTITDLGSRNGTTVNGIQCQPNVPVPIKIGDQIRFARTYDFYVQ